MAPGAVTMRSMSAASCASGQTMRLMPKAPRPPSPVVPTKSARDTRQIVSALPSRLARAQATMLTSSRPVAATKTSAPATLARASTSVLVPLPVTNSTSIVWKTSATSGS